MNIEIKNIGGINNATISLTNGVSLLTGRNATNRTSALRAIMTALGSDRASLKGDAKEGSVRLEYDGSKYTRQLQRDGEHVRFSGEPYLDDPTVADLFAFVLESNEARQAVRRGDDLREIIMRPIDTDQIEAEIKQCQATRDEIDTQLAEIEEIESELPTLEHQRAQKQSELTDVRAELETINAQIDQHEADVDDEASIQQQRDAAYERLQEAQSTVSTLTFDLETKQQTLDKLTTERDDLLATLEDLPDTSIDTAELENRIDDLRERKASLTRRLTDLNGIIEFNQEMLAGDSDQFLKQTQRVQQNQASLAQLSTETTICWTCGSEVETKAIDETVSELKTVQQDIVTEQSDVADQLEELVTKKQEIEDQVATRSDTEQRLTELKTEIEGVQADIDDLNAQIDAAEAEATELQSDIESLETDDYDAIIDLHQEATENQMQIEQLEDDIETLTEKIVAHEETIATQPDLKAKREAVTDQLTELRNRVKQIEQEAVTEFNEQMETVLELLGYDNLERIWIERKETKVHEKRKKTSESTFDLHVVRTTDDGAAYEDTIEHLSESEREVTGLVFALAGYLVHDVGETVPFMILDSLEAIDRDRIATLIDHFQSEAPYLVVALLTEDAAELPAEYQYIESIA